jgi:DNA-binding transcriptional LysR family regulator
MQIDNMRVFCDLVDLQNFSRTAEKHGISQSAVSQQIAQIETFHKCQLVNRKKRPLALTAAGEMFYQACKDIIERYDRFNNELALVARSASKIKLAAIFSIGMHTLQPYVKKFMSAYPRVNLSVEYLNANRIYKGIIQGKLDIGVVALPRMDRTIDVFPFENERLLFVCSPQHPLAKESAVDMHKLQGLDFVAFGKDVPTRTLIDGILNQYRITVRTVMEFDNTETIKRAIEIDTGVSILPEPTLALETERGTLKGIPFKNATFYRPTAVIVRKDKTFTQAGRYLIELLQKTQDTR